MSARAIATIWRSPPEREPARWRRRSPRVGNRSAMNSNRSANFFGRWNIPIRRFSSMVSEGNTLLFCGTNPTPRCTRWSARRLRDVLAARVTEPERTLTRPNSALSSVDLPAPFGPMIPTSSPGCSDEVAAVEDVRRRAGSRPRGRSPPSSGFAGRRARGGPVRRRRRRPGAGAPAAVPSVIAGDRVVASSLIVDLLLGASWSSTASSSSGRRRGRCRGARRGRRR